MIESKLNFPTPDGKEIFCVVNYADSVENKSDKAVVLVHGLTGYPYVHVLQVLSRYFAGRGYDVYRPALYWSNENNRSLSECTTATHTYDIQVVIDALRGQYQKLYVGGHSMAGTSLLGLTHTADAYSFIDCDYSPWDDTWSQARYIEALDAYLIGWGTESLVSKEMVAEAKNTPASKIDDLIGRIHIPSQVIIAEFGQATAGKSIFSALTCEKDFRCVQGAGHTFVNNDDADHLAKLIFEWFENF